MSAQSEARAHMRAAKQRCLDRIAEGRKKDLELYDQQLRLARLADAEANRRPVFCPYAWENRKTFRDWLQTALANFFEVNESAVEWVGSEIDIHRLVLALDMPADGKSRFIYELEKDGFLRCSVNNNQWRFPRFGRKIL